MPKYDIEKAKKLWSQEPDNNSVFRAATEDIKEYPPEIQTIIKEEAERRLKAIEEEKERQKRVITTRVSVPVGIAESIGVSLSIVFAVVVIRLVFGGSWAKLSGMAGIMIVAALIKIWKPKKVIKDDKDVGG